MKEMTQKEFASKGGLARAKKLNKKQRLEIAMKGVKARLNKRKLNSVKIDGLIKPQKKISTVSSKDN